MITAGGFWTGYLCTQGFGAWELCEAEDVTVEFNLKYGTASFQVSCLHSEVNSLSQASMTFTIKDPNMDTGLKGEGSLYMTIQMKYT